MRFCSCGKNCVVFLGKNEEILAPEYPKDIKNCVPTHDILTLEPIL